MEMGEGESVELQRWSMVCDVDVDVGRSMLFGSEERREQMEKQRRELK